eukprot:g22308.t1
MGYGPSPEGKAFARDFHDFLLTVEELGRQFDTQAAHHRPQKALPRRDRLQHAPAAEFHPAAPSVDRFFVRAAEVRAPRGADLGAQISVAPTKQSRLPMEEGTPLKPEEEAESTDGLPEQEGDLHYDWQFELMNSMPREKALELARVLKRSEQAEPKGGGLQAMFCGARSSCARANPWDPRP